MSDSDRTLEALELVGGALCLDFANTVNSRTMPEHDYLMQYSDLVEWAKKLGLLSPTQSKSLQKRANENRQAAEEVLSTARRIRELFYRLFSNAAKGSEPAKKDMQMFLSGYGEAIAKGQLAKKDNHYTTAWKPDEAFDSLLWPIVHSAGELLLSEELGKVKECPNCGWLFLDTSKNQTRRWCSMDTCGARDKMRRYHRKKQAQ
jgi:predicted RNA-binding Zn ribbon-like protein